MKTSFSFDPPGWYLIKQEVLAAKKENTPRQQLAVEQYDSLGTQNTQAVVRFAVGLSVLGCILILSTHKKLHPEFIRILKQNDEKLFNELAKKVFEYMVCINSQN